jgi:hypothetical protein
LEQVAGSYECGNERSDFIKCRTFLEQLRTFQLLRKDPAAWSNCAIDSLREGQSWNGLIWLRIGTGGGLL